MKKIITVIALSVAVAASANAQSLLGNILSGLGSSSAGTTVGNIISGLAGTVYSAPVSLNRQRPHQPCRYSRYRWYGIQGR